MVTVLSVEAGLGRWNEHKGPGIGYSMEDEGDLRLFCWTFIPLSIVFVLYMCCRKKKKEREEREASSERSHPSTPSSSSPSSHPFGSNTLVAPTMPTTSYDWGQTSENSEQCFRIQLPPPYEAPPPYTSLESGGEQRTTTSRPHQDTIATAPNAPPSYNSVVDQQRF